MTQKRHGCSIAQKEIAWDADQPLQLGPALCGCGMEGGPLHAWRPRLLLRQMEIDINIERCFLCRSSGDHDPICL